MLQEQVEHLRSLFPERLITTTIPTKLPVFGDDAGIQILINNAISNIIRYTGDSDSVNITCTSKGNWIKIAIEDGGPGLSDYQNRAFQRFDTARNRASGGSGLGIAIMAKIVASHKGEFTLSKSELGGLRVSFSLPTK
jgi:K+-sensing histidine kinase KdpD